MITIGYSAPEWNGGQYLIMDALRRQVEARGWTLRIMNANFNFDRQEQQINYLIDSGVLAIVAVPIHGERIAPVIERARARGIGFYTIDRAPTAGKVDMTVQCDNHLAGRQAGEAMAQALLARYGEARGVVLELQGDLDQDVAQARRDGFHEALAPHKSIKLVSRETKWQGHSFARFTEEALREGPLDGIYLHSDMIGIVEVVPVLARQKRLFAVGDPRHIIITGVDGSPPALQAIRDGYADCVASQPINDYGIVTEYIAARLKGEPIVPGEVKREGAAWSPATLRDTARGLLLQLRTVPVTRQNVDDAYLWGNRVSPNGPKDR